MKQKAEQSNSHSTAQAGFTLIELLVVLAIMALLMTALAIDFASQRSRRSMVLASNETVTNLRKVQSYMLSSKNIADGVPAKYYIATFTSNSDSYKIQAIGSDYKFYDNIETIKLASTVNISTLAIPVTDLEYKIIEQQGALGGGGGVKTITIGGVKVNVQVFNCMQIIFSAPYGKIYVYGADQCDNSIVDVVKDPVQLAQLKERTTYILFANSADSTLSKYLEIVPITGQMTIH